MKFRTEIDVERLPGLIGHDRSIVMLGSCFTDNIGTQLERDGFDVTHNPFGPLYNPASIHNLICLCHEDRLVSPGQFTRSPDGTWHCLDFASRYSDTDADRLAERVNAELRAFKADLERAYTLIITLGTAYVFALRADGHIVGNCHKLPAAAFDRYRLSPEAISEHLTRISRMLPPSVKHVMVTVSPIRHTADGLHGNQLSKASLLMAVDDAVRRLPAWIYFPAYEIMIDDLRDYRFYAADMKHPSEVAVEYIYHHFRRAYFDEATLALADERRKQWLRAQHRPLLP